MKKTVHVVLHQHFDIIWRRNVAWYAQRRSELYRQALKLMLEKEHLTFTFSQALPFREFLGKNLEHRKVVKNFLAEGRLEIIGGMETICDLNMSSGVAILHNIEMGKEYFQKEFGYQIKAGAFEDAFGVCQQLPQILKLSGYSFYKAGRMPVSDGNNLSGNFNWQGKDGTVIRCISSSGDNSSWGWGYSDNPDDTTPATYETRYRKIFNNLLKAAETDGENVLFTITGEEHDIFGDIDLILDDLNRNSSCRYVFSTFSGYYNSLPEVFWEQIPLIERDTDLSRIFTGCYTSRIDSKKNSRLLEHRLAAAETGAATKKADEDFRDAWQKLFVMQFHDAICGCHTRENAEYLDSLHREALNAVDIPFAEVPWEPQLPDFSTAAANLSLPADIVKTFGDFTIEIKDSLLKGIKYGGTDYGPVCSIYLREENGTLWTEEYSGKTCFYTDMGQVEAMMEGSDILVLRASSSAPAFLKMWPGFSHLTWNKQYIFHKHTGMVKIALEMDWLGNSTEISLRWESPAKINECVAETPFSSMRRESLRPSGNTMQGDVFPALNWVKTSHYAVINRGTPAHAVRDGKLETVVLRSPVKRWSPWFPVTPDYSAWDNGVRKFAFLWIPCGGCLNNGSLHRIGMEFNFDLPLKKCVSGFVSGLPRNLVVCGISGKGEKVEVLIFEADGIDCVWNENHFLPYEIKRVYICEFHEEEISGQALIAQTE
jgi:hypothetical protein